MKTGPWGHWRVSYIMSMCNEIVTKYRAVLWFIWIHWYHFLLSPSFNNHHYCIPSPQKIRHLDQIMTQALEVTDKSVASWVCVTRLYQKFKAVLCFIWIHRYHFFLFPSFNNHHYCMTSPQKILHCWPNNETGHWGHWWVCYFISMCNKIVPNIHPILMVHMNPLISFSILSKLQ